jgi:deazaflavin-dependent oxidoreductase (nitroreductase family)
MPSADPSSPVTRAATSSPITRAAARMLRTRWFARAPIWLFRARLGFLLGSRLLMLEHTGRKTGARRYVALEVVTRMPGRYVVASGFGTRAQWFRNVRASPQVRIWVGGHTAAPATARLLTPAEAKEAIADYAAKHPRAWATLAPVFAETLGAPVQELPLVALDLADSHR